MSVQILQGDCIQVMKALKDNSVDAIVTDPPYALNFMGKEWDNFAGYVQRNGSSRAVGDDGGRHDEGYRNMRGRENEFQSWCQMWAAECLRVLKPGGHLLAFGGTRTYHRMACGIEDAGFEIRDSLHWIYGSGFPKSLDVSKAIDKAAGVEREVVGYDASRVRPNRLYDSGAIGNIGAGRGNVCDRTDNGATITAPATNAARQWDGWGTALKPAHEPIILARKPLTSPSVNVLEMIELSLRQKGVLGEIKWIKNAPVSDAGKFGKPQSLLSIGLQPAGETSAAPVGGSVTQNDVKPIVSDSAMNTLPGGRRIENMSALITDSEPPDCEMKFSPHTEMNANVAARESENSSPLTTSRVAGRRTVKQPGERSTSKSSERGSLTIIESFAGIATGLTDSRATVRIDKLANGTFLWPVDLPENIPGHSNTVASNVLAHGTGALNVDGCRVAHVNGENPSAARRASIPPVREAGSWANDRRSAETYAAERPGEAAGRWPPNILLDEEMAAEMDRQTGVLKSGSNNFINRSSADFEGNTGAAYGAESRPAGTEMVSYGDQGGASRFFPCFKYQAKAKPSERPKVDGINHPTIKPVSLMQWLVRLVTPPGGIVLDPFAGSGTTGEACLEEGFNAILIEREPDYIKLIKARLDKREPTLWD